MMIDELIEKLYELRREFGDREVELYTQERNRGWDDHDIDEVCFSEEDGKIVIEGKRKTECEE